MEKLLLSFSMASISKSGNSVCCRRVWKNEHPHALLVGVYTLVNSVGSDLLISFKIQTHIPSTHPLYFRGLIPFAPAYIAK